jgi:hypothetical protein
MKLLSNLKFSALMATGLLMSAGVSAMSSTPPSDPIADFQNSWAGKALAQQRNLDVNSPMIDNNILGSHNTYNSEVYRNAFRYIDPQQKHSIYDQLRIGARFIELDAHWTAQTHGAPWNWGPDLLLCHSGIGKSMGDLHVGCSLTDRFVKDGMQEVANFLNENPEEVIIMYVEDHTDGHHQELLNVINDKLAGKIYASNGCSSIPDSLTKAQVRAAGKQIVFWKDGGCSDNSGMKNLAFTGLGKVDRIWEDRTGVGAIGAFFTGGSVDKIEKADVTQAFKNGGNIVNLDDLTHNDGRMEAGIWSWDVNEPNNWGGNQDCAVQWGNGRWDDAGCNSQYHFACKAQDGSWEISRTKGTWLVGQAACGLLGWGYQFGAPTNSKDNEALKAVKGGISHVWVNASDRQSEGNWTAN